MKMKQIFFLVLGLIFITAAICGATSTPEPKISASPTSINFGAVALEATPAVKTVTIKNTGKSALTINSISITGTDSTEFGQTNSCVTIDAGGSCPVSVTFTPALPYAKKSALLTIASNDPKKLTLNVKLSGRLLPPKISVKPASVNFGTLHAGMVKSSKSVTVKNSGLSDLIISSIDIAGTNPGDFSETDNCGTVPNGGFCTIDVTFEPLVPKVKRSATLDISSNDPQKPTLILKLSGSSPSGGSSSLKTNYTSVTNTCTPIIMAAATTDGSESILIASNTGAAESSSLASSQNTNSTSLNGLGYSSSRYGQWYIEIDPSTGLPASVYDSFGTKMVLSNYTSNSVQISYYKNNVLVSGPVQLSLDATKLSQLQTLWNNGFTGLSKVTTLHAQSIKISSLTTDQSNTLKYLGLASQVLFCAADLTSDLTGVGLTLTAVLTVWSCDSAFVSGMAMLTGNETIQNVTDTTLDGTSCAGDILNLDPMAFLDCSSYGQDIANDFPSPSASLLAAPTGLTLTSTSSPINLSWDFSTNSNIAGYNIYRSAAGGPYLKMTSVKGTSASDSNVQPSTNYCYLISAFNYSGNESFHSNSVCTTTSSTKNTVSGQVIRNGVGLAGVTINLNGGGSNSQQVTDSNGNYAFTSIANGTYILTPSLTGYSFSPLSVNVTVNNWNFVVQHIYAYVPPSVSSLSPTSMTADGQEHLLTIYGSNFASGDIVQFMWGQGQGANQWNTSNSTPTVNSSSQITINMDPGTVTDTIYVRVCSGSYCSSGTQYVSVTVATVTPSVSSLSPTSMTADGQEHLLTIYGSNFASGDIVQFMWGQGQGANQWNTSNSTPTVNSSSQITINMDPGTVTDTIYVRVCSGSYCSSGTQYVSVTVATVTPSVSSLSPTSMTVNTGYQNLTIYGSNFVSGDTVQFYWSQGTGANQWNISSKTPVVNSSTQITVSMNPGPVADTIYVRVCSGSSCSSGAQYVSVH